VKCNVLRGDEAICGAYRSYTEESDAVGCKILDRRIHPDYDENTFQNDFMVLKLDKFVDFSPIHLNDDQNIPLSNQPVTVIGFGQTHERALLDMYNDFDFQQRATGMTLQEVDVMAIDESTCNGQEMYRGQIDEGSMLCAGIPEGGRDACYGDSGGPLFFEEKAGKFVQVGVVSFGSGCARPNRPGIYSRISTAYEWIQEQICDLSSNPPHSCTSPSPTNSPSESPSTPPTLKKSISMMPSDMPSDLPSGMPSDIHSSVPSEAPSSKPSYRPSLRGSSLIVPDRIAGQNNDVDSASTSVPKAESPVVPDSWHSTWKSKQKNMSEGQLWWLENFYN
jgi:hypothetical protein